MKKIFLFSFSLFLIASCTKTNDALDNDTDDTEIDDSNLESLESLENDESSDLSERAATPFTFSKFESEFPIASSSKYSTAISLSSTPNTKTKCTLTGENFGSQDIGFTCTIKGAPVSLEIVSWSATQIVFNLPVFPSGTKNVSLKFQMQKTIDGKIKTRKKSIKAAAGYINYGQYSNIQDPGPKVAEYGSSLWEVAYQQDLLGQLSKCYYTPAFAITSSYIPKKSDVLTRQGGWDETQYGVIMSDSASAKVLVYERNLKGNGMLQKKKYNYKQGIFSPKAGETTWTHYRTKVAECGI